MKVVNTSLDIIELIAIVLVVFLVVINVIPCKTKATAPECKCPCCITQAQKAPELKKEADQVEKKVEKKDAKIQ